MAIDQRKRQKKLAKQKAKRKNSSSVKRRLADTLGKIINAYEVMYASKSPVHECWAPKGMFDLGMGNVIFSRKMPNGIICLSMFLLDTFCLGVKDAHFFMLSESEYQRLLRNTEKKEELEQVPPAYLRKLVEDAESYARDLGFAPHTAYQSAKNIFGDVDKTDCNVEWEFGQDGKPFFFAGPNDSAAKVETVLNTLERNCGEGHFDYAVPEDMMVDTIGGDRYFYDLNDDESDETAEDEDQDENE